MPQTMIAKAARRTNPHARDQDCVVHVRAELVSLGGGVLLMICLLLTAVLFMTLIAPGATSLQQVIAVILVAGAWLYFFNSITEHLSITGRTLVFHAALSRDRHIPLEELEAMVLVHQGLNLENGIETIEFRCDGKKPDRVALGPCWQRNKLESFLHSVEEILRQSDLVEEIR